MNDSLDGTFEDDDFIIIIRPRIEGTEWVGEIDVSVVNSGKSILNDQDYSAMMHFTRMVCSSIPLMEENEEFRRGCEDLAESYMPVDEPEENELTVTERDGNVITLAFNSNTKGSA